MGPWRPVIWSGKLWSVLVTSHWRLSHLLSDSPMPLFRISTASMVSQREQKSLRNRLIQCELKQWFCVPGWPRSSSQGGGLAGSLGLRANSSQYHWYDFGSLTNSSAILKVEEDPEAPPLKAVFGQHILVSERQWSKTYVNKKRAFKQDFLNNNTGRISLR